MKGILLAAGKGQRLRPLTDRTPKPLLPVAGKPILTWIIEGLRNAGIDDIAIIIGHLGEQIEAYFGDGSSSGIRLRYYRQSVCNGTARAVLPAVEMLSDAPFFLGYGDILVDSVNYRLLMNMHTQFPDDSILAGWPSDTPWTGGVLQVTTTSHGERLTGLVEKPPPDRVPGRLINAGLMILQPAIIEHIRRVQPSVRGEYELTDALLSLAEQAFVHILELRSFWSDIGTPEKLKDADGFFNRLS